MAIPIRYDRVAILHVHPHKKNARRHSREGTSPRTSIRGRNPLGSSCENMVTSHRVGITHAFRLVLILSLSLLWFFANTGQSLACSCVRPGSPSEELAQSSSVFAGRVVSVREFNDPNATHDYSSTDPTTVEFEVDTIWKGPYNETIYLTTARSEASCGFTFDEGEEYIVYSRDGSTVSLYSRTALLENAEADLNELGQGRAPQTGSVGPTPEPPPTSSGSCAFSNDFGSATADATWLGIMAGLVWFGVRRQPRR